MVLHARNERRGEEALAAVPGAETVVAGDLARIAWIPFLLIRRQQPSTRSAVNEANGRELK